MRKTVTLLGVLALVLAIAAGATAAGEIALKPNSVDGTAVKNRSLHLVDLSAGAEQMVRDGWRYAHGLTKVPEANLDPALAAKINAPVTESRLDPALAAKVNRALPTTMASRVGFVAGYENGGADRRFSRSIEFPLAAPNLIGTADVVVVTPGITSTTCPGSYNDPRTSAGKLCVYIGGATEGVSNAREFSVQPHGAIGFELIWRTRVAGESHMLATYAYHAAAA